MIAAILYWLEAVLVFLVGGPTPPEARDWVTEPLENDEN